MTTTFCESISTLRNEAFKKVYNFFKEGVVFEPQGTKIWSDSSINAITTKNIGFGWRQQKTQTFRDLFIEGIRPSICSPHFLSYEDMIPSFPNTNIQFR